MDAVKKAAVSLWGSYRERWSEDYKLTIEYSGQSRVEAEYRGRRWYPASGDEESVRRLLSADTEPLLDACFQAAAEVDYAFWDCADRGLSIERLYECYRSDAELAPAELMRRLMDERGFKLEAAYELCAACCEKLCPDDVNPTDLQPIQGRTAHVLRLLQDMQSSRLAVKCDSRFPRFRRPFGAVEPGTELRLAFQCLGGEIRKAELCLTVEEGDSFYPMLREDDAYYVNLKAPDEPTDAAYCFFIEAADGNYWLCPDEGGFRGRLYSERAEGFRLTVYKKGFETPAWFRRRVMYQIFPDRFAFGGDSAGRGIEYHRSLGQTPELHQSLDEPPRYLPREFESDYKPDDFYGGTFQGIEEKLPYLNSLGIGVIYLNPIVEAASNHRYDCSDYSRPDPILGTVQDFCRLCQKAEQQGIRIILDGVFSHTGDDSLYFDRYGHYGGKGAYQSRQSPYFPWYDFRDYPADYRCWWGFESLPEVKEENPDWQRLVISGEDSVVRQWLRRGAAGWRLDVADELPDGVLSLIREAAKAEKPDAPIIGEVWEDAVSKVSYGVKRNYALGYSLDSVMNYPLRKTVLDFARGKSDAYALRDALLSQQMNYPKPLYYSLMNLLGSHDVERLRTALACDADIRGLTRTQQLEFSFSEADLQRALELEKLCAVIQFALPGVPSIYYGDEQGMCGVCDPFNRLPFKEGDAALHDCYANLAALRNSAPALSTGETEIMAISADALLILRYITGDSDVFGHSAERGVYLAVVNRGERDREFSLDLSKLALPEYRGIAKAGVGEIVRVDKL